MASGGLLRTPATCSPHAGGSQTYPGKSRGLGQMRGLGVSEYGGGGVEQVGESSIPFGFLRGNEQIWAV